MVGQDIGNEPPVITKNRDIPSQESNFTVTESLHLLLIAVPPNALIIIIDELPQIFHCLWGVLVYILEFLAAVVSLMVAFNTEFSMAVPHLLFLSLNPL